MMKYWEIIADNLSKAGWSWGCVSAVDSQGRTIWIVDAHRDGKHLVCARMESCDWETDQVFIWVRRTLLASPFVLSKHGIEHLLILSPPFGNIFIDSIPRIFGRSIAEMLISPVFQPLQGRIEVVIN